jgi:hypothetical protein
MKKSTYRSRLQKIASKASKTHEYIDDITYTYEALRKQAKEKALQNMYDINTDHGWWIFCYEVMAELAEKCGITNFKCEGFNLDRGQSIALKGSLTFIDLRDFTKSETENWGQLAELKMQAKKCLPKKLCGETYKQLNANSCELYGDMISPNSNTQFDSYNNYWHISNKRVSSELDSCAYACEEFLEAFKDTCYEYLKDSYDYLSSEESIVETIIANDYRFTVDGKLS